MLTGILFLASPDCQRLLKSNGFLSPNNSEVLFFFFLSKKVFFFKWFFFYLKETQCHLSSSLLKVKWTLNKAQPALKQSLVTGGWGVGGTRTRDWQAKAKQACVDMCTVVRRRGTVTHRAGEKGPSEIARWQGIGGGTSHWVKGLVWQPPEKGTNVAL